MAQQLGIRKIALLTVFLAMAAAADSRAACIDLGPDGRKDLDLSGTLSRPVFPGSPGFTDVAQGDEPDPAYILTLDNPVCAVGDEFIKPDDRIETVHLVPTDDGAWFDDMNRYIGMHVVVGGREPYGAHTRYHRAPLLMMAVSVKPLETLRGSEAGLAAVQAFYTALAAGDGASATGNVVAEKRQKGPLSAKALQSFYGNLKEPLMLVSVTPVSQGRYRAIYRFKAASTACNGSSLVSVKRVGGIDLISAIRSETGC